MNRRLIACSSCDRYVGAGEPACPFCQAVLGPAPDVPRALISALAEPSARRGLSRAAVFAMRTALVAAAPAALGCGSDDGTQPRDPGRDVVASGGSSAGSAGSAQGGSTSSGPAGLVDLAATAGAGGTIALDDPAPGADAGADAGDSYAPVPIYGGVFPDPLSRAGV